MTYMLQNTSDIEIITNGPRKYFHPWEWKEIQSHFADYRMWKYNRIYRWSYPETEYGLENAMMWNNITESLLEGQWK
jgi:hypothetical protein